MITRSNIDQQTPPSETLPAPILPPVSETFAAANLGGIVPHTHPETAPGGDQEARRFCRLIEAAAEAPSFGWYIKHGRERCRLMVRELASAAGVSGCHITNIEIGRRAPAGDLVVKLADALGYDRGFLLRVAEAEQLICLARKNADRYAHNNRGQDDDAAQHKKGACGIQTPRR